MQQTSLEVYTGPPKNNVDDSLASSLALPINLHSSCSGSNSDVVKGSGHADNTRLLLLSTLRDKVDFRLSGGLADCIAELKLSSGNNLSLMQALSEALRGEPDSIRFARAQGVGRMLLKLVANDDESCGDKAAEILAIMDSVDASLNNINNNTSLFYKAHLGTKAELLLRQSSRRATSATDKVNVGSFFGWLLECETNV